MKNYILFLSLGLGTAALAQDSTMRTTNNTQQSNYNMDMSGRTAARDMKSEIATPALPVMQTYVPAEVMSKTTTTYGKSLYSVTQVRSASGDSAVAYQVTLLDNGGLTRSEWIGEDGAVVTNVFRTPETDSMNAVRNSNNMGTNNSMNNTTSGQPTGNMNNAGSINNNTNATNNQNATNMNNNTSMQDSTRNRMNNTSGNTMNNMNQSDSTTNNATMNNTNTGNMNSADSSRNRAPMNNTGNSTDSMMNRRDTMNSRDTMNRASAGTISNNATDTPSGSINTNNNPATNSPNNSTNTNLPKESMNTRPKEN